MSESIFHNNHQAGVSTAARGFLLMIAACAVYLVWWFVNYYPDSPFAGFLHDPVGMTIWILMFAAVFVFCLAGVILIVRGLKAVTRSRALINMKTTGIVCVIASIVLPLVISRIRFITLDIFLIIWWACLELCTANILFGGGVLDQKKARNSLIRTLAYTVISLFLYIIYPFPPVYVRFVLGTVPILLYAADMTWMVRQMRK